MNRSNRAPIIGIDLGTTYSLCSVLQADRAVILPNSLGEALTPSAVSIDESGNVLVGAAARSRAITHPHESATVFKRDMGTDKLFTLGKRKLRPEELSALVLKQLKQDAEHALGCTIEEAVITVPAYFGDAQRSATRLAGELAGLKVERIINEPTAAALAYGLHARERELRAIVLDLGGGTFDVTVLEIIEGVIEVQASAGDARLGGEDFVEALVRHFGEELRTHHKIDADNLEIKARLHAGCERAKRILSTEASARIPLVTLAAGGKLDGQELIITREQANILWQPLFDRMRAPIARALRDAKATPEQLDEVLLVGGATRMPGFVELAARSFGRMPSRHLPADEAVALGAAVQAALKQGDQAVQDLVVTDVAPFSMGIAIASTFGTRRVAGVFSPIIDRGTVIPVSRSEQFFTVDDGQTQIQLEVYQGEHSMCRDNTKLGEYTIKDLPRKAAGEVSIEVRFTYDLNGILEVESRPSEGGATQTLVVQQRPGSLSPKQVEQARAAMAKLKFHPRDSLPNRTALARAEALFGELSGEQRQQLSHVMAALRGALETQDAAAIEALRERLIAVMDSIRSGH